MELREWNSSNCSEGSEIESMVVREWNRTDCREGSGIGSMAVRGS